MESQTSAISQQNEFLISKQKLAQIMIQEHSNQLVSEYHCLHAEMREKVKNGFSGVLIVTFITYLFFFLFYFGHDYLIRMPFFSIPTTREYRY